MLNSRSLKRNSKLSHIQGFPLAHCKNLFAWRSIVYQSSGKLEGADTAGADNRGNAAGY